MATMCLAMWLQEVDPGGNRRLIMLAILLIAFAVVVAAVILIFIAVKAMKTMEELTRTADEVKGKVMPLLDEVLAISRTSRAALEDAAPKMKTITDNLMAASETVVEVSRTARSAAAQLDTIITDVNVRAQRQVARVDGMVTATLTATAELAEAVTSGLRVPAQKIGAAAMQAKYFAEGLLARIRSNMAKPAEGGE